MLDSNRNISLPLAAAFIIISLGLAVSLLMSKMALTNSLALSLGLVLFILAFVKTEVALYLLIFSMLLSPEISFGILSETGVSGGRAIVIRLDDLFLLLIAFGWLAKTAINKSMGLVEKSPLNSSIYIYTAVFTIATGLGILFGRVEPPLGFFNVLKLIQYFILYFMVLNNISSEARARRLVTAALAVCLIIAIYSLSQIPSGERVSAPFEGEGGEPNTLGGYMLLMFSITMALFLESSNLYKRIGYLSIALLCLISLFYTESRSSYLGLLFAVIVLTVMSKRRNLLLLGIVLTVVFSSIILPERVIERINFTFQSQEEAANPFQQEKYSTLDSSTRARLVSWEHAFDGWKKHPFMGWGVTGFEFIDAQYMKVLVETGALGFIAFLLLLAKILRETRRMTRLTRDRYPFYRAISLGFLAGFVGLCGHALGANTFIIIRIMEPFWLFAGIVISIPKILPAAAPVKRQGA